MNTRNAGQIAVVLTAIFLAMTAAAEVPQMINYQGRLTDDQGDPVDGTYNIRFAIYSEESEGTLLWANDTRAGQPVQVTGGLFTYQLGSVVPFPNGLFSDSVRWLGIKVGDDEEISERIRLISVPYAFRVATIDGASGGTIWGDAQILSDERAPGDLFVAGKATIGPGCTNTGSTAFVAGSDNSVSGNSVISGGTNNTAASTNNTIGGGSGNIASGMGNVIGGGNYNEAHGEDAAVLSGSFNVSNYPWDVIAGGNQNIAEGGYGAIGGGKLNYVGGQYSAILGGYADTIGAGANYSYLFGVDADLTEDSTFMVDMPHIRFGDETDGYEFPPEDGDEGQVMTTDGNGRLSWTNASEPVSSGIAYRKESTPVYVAGGLVWTVTDSISITIPASGVVKFAANIRLTNNTTSNVTTIGLSSSSAAPPATLDQMELRPNNSSYHWTAQCDAYLEASDVDTYKMYLMVQSVSGVTVYQRSLDAVYYPANYGS